MNDSAFDLLVIGGGITGAGIALDATARGLKVALIEMQDFAAGTSGRSTKLIHGGLRYLKQLEFKLVAEVGKERKIIHKNAPHLTKPEKMLLPITKNGSLGLFSAKLGMLLYEWLANVKTNEKHHVLNVAEIHAAEPLLQKDDLLGGILFYEYRTDDARLTIEVIKEAVSRGTLALNYLKASEFLYDDEKVSGAVVIDQLHDTQYKIKAKYIINATGPWVDDLDDLDKKHDGHKLHITKGVHIVVDGKKLDVKQSVYFDTHDKRMVFIIPRDGKTYIGTTDTFYEGSLLNPKITVEDKNYLLSCVNNFFPNNKLTLQDIESSWVGLRPLINKPGKGPSEISRKDEVFISKSGLIIIAGGKLTGYRKMAQRVVDIVANKLKNSEQLIIPECSTDQIQLSGGKIKEGLSFSEFIKTKIERGIALGLLAGEVEILAHRYGSNIDELYNILEKLNQEKNELPVLIRSQLVYAIEHELCYTPSDFFIRRVATFYFDIGAVRKWRKEVLVYMQHSLQWDHVLADKFKKALEKALEEI